MAETILVTGATGTVGIEVVKQLLITGGEALSYGETAEILSKELGKKVNYVNIP
jgi:uncharacterized protein YbjT (DUF2867 family)